MFERRSTPERWLKIGLLLAALFLSAAQPSLHAQGDFVAPQLTGLSFSTATVDTSRGPATLTVDFSASDDLSGVTYAAITFISPTGKFEQGGAANFKPANGIATFMDVTFPEYSPAGTWKVNFLQLTDAAGNFVSMSANDLANAGFPTQITVHSVSDTVAPKLTELTLTPGALDATTGPAKLTVAFKATDNLSGVALASIAFVSPNGKVTQMGNLDLTPTEGASGSFSVNFPQYSQSGTWTVGYLALTDAAGNSRSLTAAALDAVGMPSQITLNSVSDTTAPKLKSLSFAPALLDANTGPATLTASFAATDDLSGVASATIGFMGPEGNANHAGTVNLTPGTSVSNSVAVIFPQYSATGTWTVSYLTLTDAAGNSVTLRAPALAGLGFPTQVTVGSAENHMTMESSPSGMSFTVDGKTYTTPKTLLWASGSSHAVAFASPVSTGPGSRYAFATWEDGTALNPRTIIAPDAKATYTATFGTQYLLQETARPMRGSLQNTPASPDGYYDAGAYVLVQATAPKGFEFVRFSGDLKGKANPQTVTMEAPKDVVAHFKRP